MIASSASIRRSTLRRSTAGCASRGGSGWISSITPAVDHAADPSGTTDARSAHRRVLARRVARGVLGRGARPRRARLLDLRRRYGPDSITANACAKATNEDNYLLQKYLRAVIGTNNIDHCARLCHAGSVAGLQLALGSSAMSNAIAEMPDLECFMVIGSNTAETHPVIGTFLKQAVERNGARLIVVDPRQTEMTHFAELWLREKPGTDTRVQCDGACDRRREAVRRGVGRRPHRGVRRVRRQPGREDAGVGRRDHRRARRGHRRAARIYAGAQAAAMYWGMGISQSTTAPTIPSR